MCQLGVFIDCVEQLHVSAFIGHRQVVLREMNKLHWPEALTLALRASLCRDLYITGFVLTILLGLLMLLIRVRRLGVHGGAASYGAVETSACGATCGRNGVICSRLGSVGSLCMR